MSNPFINTKTVSMSIDTSSLVSNIEWKRIGTGKNPKGNLVIIFNNKTNDKYTYTNVPVNVLQEMLLSESIGQYFHINIKNKYDTHKEII